MDADAVGSATEVVKEVVSVVEAASTLVAEADAEADADSEADAASTLVVDADAIADAESEADADSTAALAVGIAIAESETLALMVGLAMLALAGRDAERAELDSSADTVKELIAQSVNLADVAESMDEAECAEECEACTEVEVDSATLSTLSVGETERMDDVADSASRLVSLASEAVVSASE